MPSTQTYSRVHHPTAPAHALDFHSSPARSRFSRNMNQCVRTRGPLTPRCLCAFAIADTILTNNTGTDMVTHDRWPPSDPLCSPVFAVASEYALRVMRVLASVAASSPLTRHVIAQASLIPLSDLDRVLGRLARHGFIRRRRTAGGMYTLARPATDIQVIDVIRALQPLERIRSCPLGKPEHCDGLCPLHRRLDESIGAVIGLFGATNIQQLVDEPPRPAAASSVEPP